MFTTEINIQKVGGLNMSNKNNRKIGIVADLHIGCRGGSHVWRSFIKSYLLDYMLPIFKANNVTHILQLGDLMDVRRSLYGLDRYWIVSELFPALRENNMVIHTLTGNHDCNIRDITSYANWSLWFEAESQGCAKAYTTPQDVQLGDLLVSVAPWVSKENVHETIKHVESTKSTINVGHWELESFLLSKNSLSKSGTFDAELLNKFDMSLSGHFHTSSSKCSDKSIIKYLGSPYCLDWGSYDDGTEHGVYLLDELTMSIEFLPNPDDRNMFRVIQYNYEEISSKRLGKKYLDVDYLNDELGLRDSVVRIEVINRVNSSHWKKFNEVMRSVNCVNYSTVDKTKVLEIDEQEVTANAFKLNTLDILLEKVNSTDNEEENFRYEEIGNKLKKVYTKCLNDSNLV